MERKFTFLHLEIRPLGIWDIIALSFYALLMALHFLLTHINNTYRLYGLIIIPFFVWYLVATTAFGLRFRNIYFFVPWVFMSFLFLLEKNVTSYYPIGVFILYQFLRLFFWRNYQREFIPFTFAKGHYYHFNSKTEGRTGGTKDKSLMKVLFWLGTILLVCCLSGLVGMKA